MDMYPDPLLETNGEIDSLTIERALFKRRSFSWKETDRKLISRLSWNEKGLLSSIENGEGVQLYAYDDKSRKTASYRLDTAGVLIGREILEYGEPDRLTRRIVITVNPHSEEVFSYEYDDSGRMKAERRGNKVRVEKYNSKGRIEQEYLYDGENSDLISDYNYDKKSRLLSITVKTPEGTQHRKTDFTYDEKDRLASEKVTNAEGRIIKDEVYAYGAVRGKQWLERVTWIPTGRRKGKRRPSEVIYRSFTLGGKHSRLVPAISGSTAFENGVYTGPFVDGKPEGKGVFQYNDSSRYEGEFRNGLIEGYGKITWPDGRLMEGEFRDGVLEGSGFCIWADGSRYDGDFKNGKMHGPGVFVWADGTRFEGLFENGKRTSQGAWEKPEDS